MVGSLVLIPNARRAWKGPEIRPKRCSQVCAEACFVFHKSAGYATAQTDTVAGIDGGNHCYCGAPADLHTASVQAKSVPLAECQTTPCRGPGGSRTNCGGQDRLIAYSFECAGGDV